METAFLVEGVLRFSTLSAGRWSAAGRVRTAFAGGSGFSTLSAGRWSAALTQRADALPDHVFQYPKCGSMECCATVAAGRTDVKIEFQYPKCGSMECC